MAKRLIAPRTPWRENFPPVVRQCEYRDMQDHLAYRAAKSGESSEAALSLIYDCIEDESMRLIRSSFGGCEPRIVAVHAEESRGRNKIPAAYAEVLGVLLELRTDPGIVQSSVANHGGAESIYHRLVSQPTFSGYVEKGAPYFIVDDTCTAGGTAKWAGMTYDINLADSTLRRLKYRHPGLAQLWTEELGNGIETLTEGEAGHLFAAPTVDTIRNRLFEARRDLHIDGDEEPHAEPGPAAREDDQSAR